MITTLGAIRKQYGIQRGTPLFGGDSPMVPATTPQRALYNTLLDKYANAPDELSIMNADIRSEVVLSVAAGVIQWKIQANQPNNTNAIRSTENRLQFRDSFVCDRMAVMFGDELSANTNPGRVILQQWPNSNAHATTQGSPGGFGTNSPGVLTAYNGTMSATVNSVQFLSQLAMMNFLYADQAQMGTLLFTASNQAFNSFAGDRGFLNLTPTMDIKGSDTTLFQCNLPEPWDWATLAAHRVIAALMLRGLLVQGGAEYERP